MDASTREEPFGDMDHPMIRPPEADPWVERIEAMEAAFLARCARNRRIALWFLIPYGCAAGAIGITLGKLGNAGHSTAALVLGASFAVLIGCQWVQPYLWNRPVQTSSIPETAAPDAPSVDE